MDEEECLLAPEVPLLPLLSCFAFLNISFNLRSALTILIFGTNLELELLPLLFCELDELDLYFSECFESEKGLANFSYREIKKYYSLRIKGYFLTR